MIKRMKWDIYYGGYLHAGCLTTKQLKKFLKKEEVTLTTKEHKPRGKILWRARVKTEDFAILPAGMAIPW